MSDPRLIVALDVESFEEAKLLIDTLKDKISVYKIGSQLFTACGPKIVHYVQSKGMGVFLDLKFHDIPNTVANAVQSVVSLNSSKDAKEKEGLGDVFMCTLHTVGGEEMLKRSVQAATKASEKYGVTRPKLVGITVLTSEAKEDNIREIVLDRARLAQECGLDGVVASSQEASLIRETCGKDFIIVTPGIRPAGEENQDQKRVATPQSAIEAGSNYLVVGRPIVKSNDPATTAQNILDVIKEKK